MPVLIYANLTSFDIYIKKKVQQQQVPFHNHMRKLLSPLICGVSDSHLGCTQGPSCVGRTAQAASWGTVGACRDTGVPLDSLGGDTQRARVVCHRRRTWAPLGSWTWESAGLQVIEMHKESC